MIINTPGHKSFNLDHVVCDFNGTIAIDGVLIEGVKESFNALINLGLKIHVITADTHGNVRKQLEGVDCSIKILSTDRHDLEKEEFVNQLGADNVVAFGNGYNDHLMLAKARLGVAVCQIEGMAGITMRNADVVVLTISDGLNLLLKPSRLIATLRY